MTFQKNAMQEFQSIHTSFFTGPSTELLHPVLIHEGQGGREGWHLRSQLFDLDLRQF